VAGVSDESWTKPTSITERVRRELETRGRAELPAAELEDLARVVYNQLEMRVGSELYGILTEEQRNEVNCNIDSGKPGVSSADLDRMVPHYRDIVTRQLDRIVKALGDWSETHLADSSA
jgi:hypothetical protein